MQLKKRPIHYPNDRKNKFVCKIPVLQRLHRKKRLKNVRKSTILEPLNNSKPALI